MNKNLSVVIPAYNSEDTIEKCIESVIAECESCNLSYEVIVVDDGSKDNTLKILNEISKSNSNLVVISQQNSGPSAARNNGMKNAKGKFIALNDSDDMWIEGRLKKQLEYLENNPDVALISSQYADTCRSRIPMEVTFKKEVFHNYYSPPTSVFRTSLTSKYFFPENMKYSEDMRFFITVLLDNKCVYFPVPATKSITGKNQFGESGLSSKLWEIEKGELSNIMFAFINKRISLGIYICATFYSIAKFFRRCLLSIKYIRRK